jgi:hypothetical protein
MHVCGAHVRQVMPSAFLPGTPAKTRAPCSLVQETFLFQIFRRLFLEQQTTTPFRKGKSNRFLIYV